MKKIELLSPAKDYTTGVVAIDHGADAVYIGAPAFGARAAATNSIDDIERLVDYAHTYGAKVHATVNTLLFDNEIKQAVEMIHKLDRTGVDALIIQDMGLLQCNLPAIPLHASTQCFTNSIEKIKFLQSVGFERIILPRETSLQQIRTIAENTDVEIEVFVHGSLCVSYSGQCYMSQYLTGRSGNRGACAQPCRSTYDLYTDGGRELIHDKPLLSLKDFSAADHVRALVESGVTSLKIEGRLKDREYVKNVTAYYRQLLDSIEGVQASSSGKTTFSFQPDIEKTFNRQYTDYFLNGRHKIGSITGTKSVGKEVAKVKRNEGDSIVVDAYEKIVAGDGVCYTDKEGRLQGFYINRVEGDHLYPNKMTDIRVGTTLWRNHDQQFEKMLQGKTSTRKVAVDIVFSEIPAGFFLQMKDEDGIGVARYLETDKTEARDKERSHKQIVAQLSKMGDTPFVAREIVDNSEGRCFIPTSSLNQLRREALELLTISRITKDIDVRFPPEDEGREYPMKEVDYRANITNHHAEEFYKQHHSIVKEWGIDYTRDFEGKALMTTKHCIRYEMGCCKRKQVGNDFGLGHEEKLFLHNNGRWLRLDFDCKECQMMIFKSDKPFKN